MTFTSRIEIDLSAVERNVGVIRRLTGPGVGLCAVIKADGYGLGAVRLAKRLAIAGVDMYAVYSPDQAKALLDASLPGAAPILILMPVREFDRGDPLYRAVLTGQVHFTVHDEAHARSLADEAQALGVTIPVQVEVDTGLGRGGSSPVHAVAMVNSILSLPRLRLAGVFTHCASPDSDPARTREQSEAFDSFLQAVSPRLPRDCVIHQASTYGAFRWSRLHRGMVRVGLALLGFAEEEFADPSGFEHREIAAGLSPSVRWVSTLIQTKWIEAGSAVGYGSTWRAKRRTRLGLVPVGYADGFPRALSNKARVGVELANGIRAYAPQVGTVSMDQITIDLTDLPEAGLGVGAWVEIVGNDRSAPNHLPTLARQAGTITHELLCRFGPRVARHYVAAEETRPQSGNAGATFRVTTAGASAVA